MTDLRTVTNRLLETPGCERLKEWVSIGPVQRAAVETFLEAALEQQEQEAVEIKPPNPEGATQCIVRWMAETPAGWIGAWDREALQQFVASPRREWQGLTDEEMVAIAHRTCWEYRHSSDPHHSHTYKFNHHTLTDFRYAIEAALKERNHD